MADIKTKKKQEISIKKLDRTTIIGQNLKSNIVNVKEKTKDNYEKNEDTAQEYAENKVNSKMRDNIYNIPKLNKIGKQNFEKTKENIIKGKARIKKVQKGIKNIKQKGKMVLKETKRNIKTVKNTVKSAKNTVKTTEKTAKATAKATKQVAKGSVKMAQRTAQMTKQAIKTTIQATKVAIKTTIAIIKAIIAATKALVSAIIAGGWVAVVVIVVICLIAMICSSVFGIFFSSENTGSTVTVNGTEQIVTMNKVISGLNIEFMNKLTQIQQENTYDEYEIDSQKTEWKDILAVYVAKFSNGDNTVEMMTLNDEKVNTLKEIFWTMNEITSNTETKKKQVEVVDDKGNVTIQEKDIKVLKIIVTGKNANQMSEQYNFNQNQRNQLAELQKDEYADMWSAVIYGSLVGSNDIVKVAMEQIGNVGGEPYWSWYGFENRVEWCACFVSWCANQCGYIDSGIIPKFASCQSEGVAWFKACDLWKEKGYIPKARRYYIF